MAQKINEKETFDKMIIDYHTDTMQCNAILTLDGEPHSSNTKVQKELKPEV